MPSQGHRVDVVACSNHLYIKKTVGLQEIFAEWMTPQCHTTEKYNINVKGRAQVATLYKHEKLKVIF